MLSDALHQMQEFLGEYNQSGLNLSSDGVAAMAFKLRAFEVEARNMETRLDQLGTHVPILPPDIADTGPFRRPS